MLKPANDLTSNEVKPSSELEKRTWRVFSTDYTLAILSRTDDCKRSEISDMLRREKLYSAQLQAWQREFAEHGVEGLRQSKPDPAPVKTAESRCIIQLEKENARLSKKLPVWRQLSWPARIDSLVLLPPCQHGRFEVVFGHSGSGPERACFCKCCRTVSSGYCPPFEV